MIIDLENLSQRAHAKKAENLTFFKKLKKRKPKDLDKTAMEIHDSVFEEINCLQCANCCKTTGPLFTKQDIERISKHLKMKEVDFENQYLRIDEEGDWVLQEVPCAFLGADNYCSIYEVRPKACRGYPHTDRKKIYQIGKLTVTNTSICPAAYEIVERMKAKLGG